MGSEPGLGIAVACLAASQHPRHGRKHKGCPRLEAAHLVNPGSM
jgi:hypothetical protein